MTGRAVVFRIDLQPLSLFVQRVDYAMAREALALKVLGVLGVHRLAARAVLRRAESIAHGPIPRASHARIQGQGFMVIVTAFELDEPQVLAREAFAPAAAQRMLADLSSAIARASGQVPSSREPPPRATAPTRGGKVRASP